MRLFRAPAAHHVAVVHAVSQSWSASMYDLAYVGLTLGFFALMLGYVAGCARIGRGAEPSAQDTHAARTGGVVS